MGCSLTTDAQVLLTLATTIPLLKLHVNKVSTLKYQLYYVHIRIFNIRLSTINTKYIHSTVKDYVYKVRSIVQDWQYVDHTHKHMNRRTQGHTWVHTY